VPRLQPDQIFQVLESEERKREKRKAKRKKPCWPVRYDSYRSPSEKKKKIRKYSIRCGSHFNPRSKPTLANAWWRKMVAFAATEMVVSTCPIVSLQKIRPLP